MSLRDWWPAKIEQPSIVVKDKEREQIARDVERFLRSGGRIQSISCCDDYCPTIEERVVRTYITSGLRFEQIAQRFGITRAEAHRIIRESKVNKLTLNPEKAGKP